MAQQIPEKIARIINDFRTINLLINLIEHEMEKRIIARHGLIKIDALLELLPQLKNSIRRQQSARAVARLERLIARLRQDYENSIMQKGRDALSAHSLLLDLKLVVQIWLFLGKTTFGVLLSDLDEIEQELLAVCPGYRPEQGTNIDAEMQTKWRQQTHLGDPTRPRYACIYPALATAGIISALPTTARSQENLVRAAGLATFLRQVRILADCAPPHSTTDRLFAEILLNDYLALWELLFISQVRNDYGASDDCLLEYWQREGWEGAACLAKLKANPHPQIDIWRSQVRNKFSAHVDPRAPLANWELSAWPMTVEELFIEVESVVRQLEKCARCDIRSKVFFIPPTALDKNVLGLTGQEGKLWNEG